MISWQNTNEYIFIHTKYEIDYIDIMKKTFVCFLHPNDKSIKKILTEMSKKLYNFNFVFYGDNEYLEFIDNLFFHKYFWKSTYTHELLWKDKLKLLNEIIDKNPFNT